MPRPPPRPTRSARGTLTLVRIPVGGGSGRVPLRVHWTLLVALPWFAGGFAPVLSDGRGVRAATWALGLLLAVALFASVALHELAHTAVGVRLGARVRGITLMFLGGVSEMSRPPSGNAGEVLMSLAGPAMSLVLAGVLALVASATAGLGREVVGLLARVNLVIGIFNLLPAYPLDGGRVLRGALAWRLGRPRATAAASIVGRVVALALGVLGALNGMLFVTLVAAFVFLAATMEARVEKLDARLATVPVAELMEPAHTVSEDARLLEAADRLLWSRGRALVVEREGVPVGLLTRADLARAPRAVWAEERVSSWMAELPPPVAPEAPASEALHRMNEFQTEALPVMREGGALAGLVRIEALSRFAEEAEAEAESHSKMPV